jgi:VanZ family protein
MGACVGCLGQMWQAETPSRTFVPSLAPELPNRPLAFATHVLPALAYASVIFYAGLVRMGELPEVGFIATDKLLHALVFGGLSLLLARTVHYFRAGFSLAKKLGLGCVGASLLGLLLEVFQSFTRYRSADFWDWFADTVGALLAVGLAFAFFAFFPRRAHG